MINHKKTYVQEDRILRHFVVTFDGSLMLLQFLFLIYYMGSKKNGLVHAGAPITGTDLFDADEDASEGEEDIFSEEMYEEDDDLQRINELRAIHINAYEALQAAHTALSAAITVYNDAHTAGEAAEHVMEEAERGLEEALSNYRTDPTTRTLRAVQAAEPVWRNATSTFDAAENAFNAARDALNELRSVFNAATIAAEAAHSNYTHEIEEIVRQRAEAAAAEAAEERAELKRQRTGGRRGKSRRKSRRGQIRRKTRHIKQN